MEMFEQLLLLCTACCQNATYSTECFHDTAFAGLCLDTRS
jgi:hypothetical protein